MEDPSSAGPSPANENVPANERPSDQIPLSPALRKKLRGDVRQAVRDELRTQEERRPEPLREEIGHRLLTKKQVAERLQCSERTVDTLAAEGNLPKIKIGRLVRFSPDAIDAYIRRRAGAAR